RLAARYVPLADGPTTLGIEARVRFVGAAAPSIEFGATSPALVALLAQKIGAATQLGFELGFHLDRSLEAIPDASQVSATDRVTLGASCCPTVMLGLGARQGVGSSGTELLGELSGEILVGGSAPSVAASPWNLTLGAQQPLGRSVAILAGLDVGLSSRQDPGASVPLVPVWPRVGLHIGLVFAPN